MRLSTPIETIKDHYTIIVIGSGYGGGIAASRMARAGQQVCVLERGKEIQPGNYPNTAATAEPELQFDTPQRHIGSRTGLYDFRVNAEMNALVGCGLGGTSLINANVALEAERRVLELPAWPAAFRADLDTRFQAGTEQARKMLRPTPYPDTQPQLPKLTALEASAKTLPGQFYRPPINVTFTPFANGVNHVGVPQDPCNGCGDCVSGCNYRAKNTTLMNYLPDAKNHGAEIFTQASVKFLERQGDRWLVHYQVLNSGREVFDAPTLFVSADIVILGAGTLGSTEILLRSQAQGLTFSPQLGQRFSGNGDVGAFGYNCDRPINGIGFGHKTPEGRQPVGPCITGIIDQRAVGTLEEAMVIEEGSIPGAIAKLLPEVFAGANAVIGQNTAQGLGNRLKQWWRQLVSAFAGPYQGAIHNTQTYLVMSHDSDSGELYLNNDRLRIRWPGAGEQPLLKTISDRLQASTIPLRGSYIRNPLWTRLFGHDLITVHPLGGCVMGETAATGVVNHKGQVFSGTEGTETYPGLYVSDGSVIPTALAVNPLLTISAVTERACALIAEDHGWQIDYSLPEVTPVPVAEKQMGLQFTETMKGFFSKGVTDDYQKGFDQGKAQHSPFEFTLTVKSENLKDMLENYQHQATMIGSVKAPALATDPLTVTNGTFNLFVFDPDRVGARQMLYQMVMVAESGQKYFMSGFKEVKDDPGLDLWHDTTTLFITVHEGESEQSPVLGKGILHIHPTDFLRQMTTMAVSNAPNPVVKLEALARFGLFFAGTLFEVYGGVLARPAVFAPDAPPRVKRPLRVGAPEIYPCKSRDGVDIRLTRYKSPQADGSKLPVILCHGLGVSSLIFAIDTLETTLLEYLYAAGYDVWLLDYRSSILLPASKQQFSADDIALNDYPAAVDQVRSITGAAQVDMVVHCYGATTFFMAMLRGLQGVRSAVCSQIATHMVVPLFNALKSGLHVPDVLDALGVRSLTTDAKRDEAWWEKLLDDALRLFPVDAGDADTNPVSRRISFLYGQLYEINQLNTATYNALHELFGVAVIDAFDHLAMMVRAGHLVDFHNQEVYLTEANWKHLAIPITFIHGAKNQCWLPESTAQTLELLQQHNPDVRYVRHLIPDYGHIDCIFGKDAARDVYPYILEHLQSLGGSNP